MSEISRTLRLDASHRLWIEPQPSRSLGRTRSWCACVPMASAGRISTSTRGGARPLRVTAPYTPGHEASGEIVALGREVSQRRMGQAVAIEPGIPCRRCRYCKAGRYNQCADVRFLSVPGIDGTLCDYVAVPWDFAHPCPPA